MELTHTAKRVSFIRKVGWLSVASMLALALLAPAANAQEGNQTNVLSSDATQLCTGGPDGAIEPVDGMIAWVFIHTGVDGPGTLTANFTDAGQKTADSYIQGNLKYIIWTNDPDTLEDFSDDIEGGVLTLSHVCGGGTTTTTTETTTTETTTTETTTTETTTAPSQSVEAETDAPTPNVTLPPTDTLTGPAAPSTDSWRILLIAGAALLASVLVLSPAKASRRR